MNGLECLWHIVGVLLSPPCQLDGGLNNTPTQGGAAKQVLVGLVKEFLMCSVYTMNMCKNIVQITCEWNTHEEAGGYGECNCVCVFNASGQS